MIKVYVKNSALETGTGELIDVGQATLAAAKRGNVTDKLRHAVRAALNEEVSLEDRTTLER